MVILNWVILVSQRKGSLNLPPVPLVYVAHLNTWHQVIPFICISPYPFLIEVLNNAGHGIAVDYWGLGMMLYEMLTGLPPWYTKDRALLFKRLKSAPLTFPVYLSPNAKSLLSQLLERDVRIRLGTRGVDEVKAHPFFNGINWDAIFHKAMSPPIRPCQNVPEGAVYTENFENEFTRMAIFTFEENSSMAPPLPSFQGFTYESNHDTIVGDAALPAPPVVAKVK